MLYNHLIKSVTTAAANGELTQTFLQNSQISHNKDNVDEITISKVTFSSPKIETVESDTTADSTESVVTFKDQLEEKENVVNGQQVMQIAPRGQQKMGVRSSKSVDVLKPSIKAKKLGAQSTIYSTVTHSTIYSTMYSTNKYHSTTYSTNSYKHSGIFNAYKLAYKIA